MKNAHLAIAAAALLFASAGIAKRLAPEDLTAAHFGLSRMLVGGALLAALAGPRHLLRVLRRLPPGALAGAALALAFFQWAFFAGVAGAGVAVGTLVGAGASPACADALEAIRARRMPAPRTGLAALVTAVSVWLLSTAAPGHGVAFALGAALSFAVYASIARRLERSEAGAGLATSAIALVGAGLFLVPAAAPGAGALATPLGLAVVAWLAVVTTAIAYRLFVPALREVPAARALAILQIQPLASVIAGGLFLGEAVDGRVLAGAALMAIALAIRFVPLTTLKGAFHGQKA